MYRGVNDFKKGYQPRTNIVKDETGDLAVEKPKCHKSPGVDQIPTELIKEGGRTIR